MGNEDGNAEENGKPNPKPTITRQIRQRFEAYNSEIENFELYIDRFECYLDLEGVPEGEKVKELIASMGPKVYAQLAALVLPKKPKDLTYKQVKDKLQGYLMPKPLSWSERLKFRA